MCNHNGRVVRTITGNDSGHHSEFPVGLALDPHGNIHVAAQNAINVFNQDDVVIRKYGDDLKGPLGIVIDGEGYCIVSESEGNCLSIFDPQGYNIHTVALRNCCRPSGLALDPKDGILYVASCSYDIVFKYCITKKRIH